MSDRTEKRPAWGNLNQQPRLEGQREEKYSPYPHRRVLAEECLSVTMQTLRRIYGRRKLLKAADAGSPISVQLADHSSYSIHIYWEPHRLPGRTEKWSDIAQGNCRLYIICPCCQRSILILYKNPQSLVSDLPPIGCKRCLGLVYASENSCKNKWWREIIRPLRRLYRRREKLFARKRTCRVSEELERIEGLIFIYSQRANPKRRTRPPSGARRPYRNVGLILGNH
jgi:hypothetical protein